MKMDNVETMQIASEIESLKEQNKKMGKSIIKLRLKLGEAGVDKEIADLLGKMFIENGEQLKDLLMVEMMVNKP